MKNKGNLEDLSDSSEEEDQTESKDQTKKRFKSDVEKWLKKRKKVNRKSGGAVFGHSTRNSRNPSYKNKHKSAPRSILYNPKYIDK